MRHRLSGRKFGRASGPRRAMFRIMVTEFLRHGRITTTVAKAKEVRRFAERMLTLSRGGTLHDRRRAAAFITDSRVINLMFDELGPRFKDRSGGYTRIVKLGLRRGDAAEMAVLELVDQ